MQTNYNEIFKDYPDVITVEDLQNMIGKKYIIPKQSVIEFINVARI